MSQFLGTTEGDAGVGIQCYANDLRLLSKAWGEDFYVYFARNVEFTGDGFRSDFWPRSYLDASGNEWLESIPFDRPELTRGRNSRVVISGITRDVYGSALGSCAVKLFRTSTDEKVDQTTSHATTGAFSMVSPYYPDGHYVVAYRSGSPDVQGTSANTLIGV